MWRNVAGVFVFSLVARGADQPPPVRVPAQPLSTAEESKRQALANFGTARLRQRSDNTLAAAKRLETAAKLDPAAVTPRRELVSVYADLGRDAAAIRTARDVLKADPQDADIAHHLAKLLFEVKRYPEAAEVLTAAVDSPRLANRATKKLAMRTDLARCRERANDAAGTEAAWQAVRELLRAEQHQLLKEGFTAAELDHQAATAAEKHGRSLIARKQFDAAADAFRTARDLYTDVKRANDRAGAARLHRNLAELFAAKGDAAESVKQFEAYLAFKPRDAATYERYAEQLRAAGRDSVVKLRAIAYDGPAAAKWVMLAELARTPTGFGEANVQFAELAKLTADADFFRILVRTYAAADTSGAGLLDIAESLFPAAEAEVRRKPPTVSAADAARRQAFAKALVESPALALKMTRAARLGSGTPRSPELWELLAWACGRAGRPEEVEAALTAALTGARDDGSLRTFQRLYHHLTAQRKWQAALDLCDRSQAFGTKLVSFYRAMPLAEIGRGEDAMKALAVAQLDNAFPSRREKLHVLDILGRYDEMLKECDAAMSEFTTPAEVHSLRYQRAQAYLGLKQFAEAEAELRGLLEDDPDDVLALNNLGYNLAEQNRKLDDAERLVRRAIEIDTDERAKAGEPSTDHAAYLDSLAWVLFRKGKLKDARDLLEKAVLLPEGLNDPTVWDHLGDAAFRLGDTVRAKEAWTAAAEQYKTTHMGRHLGRRDEVLRKLKRID
ncbi:tetratricopeptide repeat protein [Limnoglobus roseus]|uniref:Tetratricopeptide repeat protein n=1 Tax=Limnoglobus roseus TaxID=2598579 RepID=A0A5C1AHS7_9BACT|nr:tetratricopeptide repeat protein [Limnoglobus roseus]